MGLAVLGAASVYNLIDDAKRLSSKKDDWKEIVERETRLSRADIVMEDPVLLGAVLGSELKPASTEEVISLKQVLNYLREKQEKETTAEGEQLKPQTLDERVESLQAKIDRTASKGYAATIFTTFGGITPAMGVGAYFSGDISETGLLVLTGISESVTAGLVAAYRADLRIKKKLQEQVSWQLRVKNHPISQGDNLLAEVVYELDMHPSDDEITNIKKVLDHLRKTNDGLDKP